MSLLQKEAEAYLDRINCPQQIRENLSKGPKAPNALDALTSLCRCHLATVPFENLELHYASCEPYRLDTDVVYGNIVTKRRGGVCGQAAQLFAKLLRGLGWAAYNTGVRLNAPTRMGVNANIDKSIIDYGPWVHVNTIVRCGKLNYVVDIAYGPNGSPSPIPLIHDERVIDMLPNRQRRMLYQSIPGWDPEHRWWRYQLREGDDMPWIDIYCFVEREWLDKDFTLLFTGLRSTGLTWFNDNVVCFRMLYANDEPVGYLLLQRDKLIKRCVGEEKILRKMYNEEERLEIFEQYFDIQLDPHEKLCIQGKSSELKYSYDFFAEGEEST